MLPIVTKTRFAQIIFQMFSKNKSQLISHYFLIIFQETINNANWSVRLLKRIEFEETFLKHSRHSNKN